MHEKNITHPYTSVASTESKVRGFNITIIVIAVLTTVVTSYKYALNVTSESSTLVAVMEVLLGLGQFVVIVLSLVFFFIFINRSHKNLHSLGAEKLTFTPGWCVGWFFIPVMNLIKPYKAVREIWENSMPRRPVQSNTSPSISLIGWWWAFWLISNFAGYVVFRLGLKDGMMNTPLYDILYVISDGTNVLSSIFTIKLVAAIHGMQESRYRETQSETPAAAASLQAASEVNT